MSHVNPCGAMATMGGVLGPMLQVIYLHFHLVPHSRINLFVPQSRAPLDLYLCFDTCPRTCITVPISFMCWPGFVMGCSLDMIVQALSLPAVSTVVFTSDVALALAAPLLTIDTKVLL